MSLCVVSVEAVIPYLATPFALRGPGPALDPAYRGPGPAHPARARPIRPGLGPFWPGPGLPGPALGPVEFRVFESTGSRNSELR